MKLLHGTAKAKIPRPILPPKRPPEAFRKPAPPSRQKIRKLPHDPLFEALREELGL